MILALEDGHIMTSLIQAVRSSKARGARTDDGDPFSGADLRNAGLYIAILESGLNDGELVLMNGDRVIIHATSAGFLAERRADTSGKLWEVIGLEKTLCRIVPLVVVDLVIPLGNEVVKRAACDCRTLAKGNGGLAERDTAVHAAGALFSPLLHGDGGVKLIKILDPILRGDGRIIFSLVI